MLSVTWGHQPERNAPCQGLKGCKGCPEGDKTHKEWTPPLANHCCVSCLCGVFHQSTQVCTAPEHIFSLTYIHVQALCCDLVLEPLHVTKHTRTLIRALFFSALPRIKKGIILTADSAKRFLLYVDFRRTEVNCVLGASYGRARPFEFSCTYLWRRMGLLIPFPCFWGKKSVVLQPGNICPQGWTVWSKTKKWMILLTFR